MITEKRKQTLKLIFSIAILVLLFLFVVIKMIQYEVEGETNMPYKLSKIVVIGTVEGIEINEADEKNNSTTWNMDICQSNDVYFYIDQNPNNLQEDELIKSIQISNIKITEEPEKGEIKTYMPNNDAGTLFVYDDQFLVEENLEYKGASQSSATNLEVGSKGGEIKIRFSNINIGNYKSSEKKEVISHDSSLLKKIETTNEEIKFSVSFDFTIETTKNKYKANISLNLPTGNLDEEEKCNLQKTDMSDIIFKKVK